MFRFALSDNGNTLTTEMTEEGTITLLIPGSGEEIHNFTESALSSNFYSFGSTANLSTSKGTINYDGLTLTRCLKIESATVISYTTNQESILTLVMNTTIDDPTARIKIDDFKVIIGEGRRE